MQDLRVTELRALSDLGATMFMEVAGKLVMRHGRRLYDHANHPDPMLDLEEAGVRFHSRASSSEWQAVPRLSINRERLLLLAPRIAAEAGDVTVRGELRTLLVSLICGQLQVFGKVTVPAEASVSSYLHNSKSRFLVVTDARVRPHNEGVGLGDFKEPQQVCYVNVRQIDACLESDPPSVTQPPEPPT